MIGWWPLDKGEFQKDHSGFGNDYTISSYGAGNCDLTPFGAYGFRTSAALGGLGVVDEAGVPWDGNDLTLSAWTVLDNVNAVSGGEGLISKQTPSNWDVILWSHQTTIRMGSSGNTSYVQASRPSIDEPHLITGTVVDGGAWKIYIDGLEGGSTSSRSISATAGRDWEIGSYTNLEWEGLIWDVRIYNRALSAREVWEMYNPATRFDLYGTDGRRVFFVPPAIYEQVSFRFRNDDGELGAPP